MLEKQIEAYLTKRVKEEGGMSLKFISSQTGVPDRVVLLYKRTWFVELKTPKGKLSARQKLVIDDMTRQGAHVWVLYGKEDVDNMIQILGGLFRNG